MKRPRVKDAHDPVRFPDGRIRIGTVQYGVGAEIRDENGHVWRALQLMDGSRESEAIVTELQAGTGGLDAESARLLVDELCRSGYVEDAAATYAASFTARELERYSRNESYFSWVDTSPRDTRFSLQARLRSARVAVIGLGGSGGSVAASLACAGIGHLRCVDSDRVELSNLNRQLLYSEGDIGASKVERAVERLSSMNSDIAVEGMEQRLDCVDSAARAIDGMDFVVLCADTPQTLVQLWTNDAAAAAGTPWSVCFYAGPTFMTGIFVPGMTACYRCLLSSREPEQRDGIGSGGEPLYGGAGANSVISPSAGIAGHFGALEAIYFLTGLEAQTVGRMFHQNLMIYDHTYYMKPKASAECDLCAHLASSGEPSPSVRAVGQPA
jgi:molybdopterin-synthase adenylyltransferase